MLHGELQRLAVAACEFLRLTFAAAIPDGTHGVDDEAGRKTIALGDLRITGLATD